MLNPPSAPRDLETLFQQEITTQVEALRLEAAKAALRRLPSSNHLTVAQFLGELQRYQNLWAVVSTMGIVELQRYQNLWAVVSTMGIVEFAALLSRRRGAENSTPKPRRTRLTAEQKGALKMALVHVLSGQGEGLSRADCARVLVEKGLVPGSINSDELADKLLQPLAELVQEGRLHTVGEKRLMRYILGRAARQM